MPAGVGVHDALQRNSDSQQLMARRRRRIKHRIDLRDHEIAQRACIESACRECKSRLRQARAPEIRDQRLESMSPPVHPGADSAYVSGGCAPALVTAAPSRVGES